MTGKAWPVRHYQYDDARNFTQWDEGDPSVSASRRKYLIPEFGFVTPLFKQPTEPRGRTRRLYTTRPFFHGFGKEALLESKTILGVQVTKALARNLGHPLRGQEQGRFLYLPVLRCSHDRTERRASITLGFRM